MDELIGKYIAVKVAHSYFNMDGGNIPHVYTGCVKEINDRFVVIEAIMDGTNIPFGDSPRLKEKYKNTMYINFSYVVSITVLNV